MMSQFDNMAYDSVSNNNNNNNNTQGPYSVADGIQENLYELSKLTKLMLELIQKITAINNEASSALLSTADIFTKKLNEINKNKNCGHEKFVKFFENVIGQVETDGKTLLTMSNRLQDSVIAPLQIDLKEKKTIWKTCFQYMFSYKENIQKREDEMLRSHREYNEASLKVKTSSDPKLLAYAYNARNTYVLQASSVQSLNNLMSTHVLTKIKNVINDNQTELNDTLQKHLKLFYTTQKLALMKTVKSIEKRDEAIPDFDIMTDVKQFMEKSSTKTGFHETKLVKSTSSFRRSFYMERSISLSEPIRDVLTSNDYTQPNLLRTIVSIKNQSKDVLEEIATMKALNEKDSLKRLDRTLAQCDKEVITLALQKQLELFTPDVLVKVGYSLDDIHLETSSKPNNGQRQKAHRYNDARLVKPQACSYCNKWMTVITRGLTCEVCKITVHKKCVMKVPFCEGERRRGTLPARQGRGSLFKTLNNNIYASQRKWDHYFTPPSEQIDEILQPITPVEEMEVFSETSVKNMKQSPTRLNNQSKLSSGEEDEGTLEELYYNASYVDELENAFNKKTPPSAEDDDKISFQSSGDPEPYAKSNIYLSPVELFKAEGSPKTTPVYAKVSSESKSWRSSDKYNWRRHSMPEFPSDLQMKLQEICIDEDCADESGHIYQPPHGGPRDGTSNEDDDSFYSNYPTIKKRQQSGKKCPPKKPPRKLPELPTRYEKMFPIVPPKVNNPSRTKSTPANSVAPFVPISARRATSLDSILQEKFDIISPYTTTDQNNSGYCVALYDFNPAQDGGLQLKASSKIELIEKTNEDWWKGRYKKQTGYFPSKYVLEIQENDVILKVIYDFHKQRENELSIITGQILVMLKKTSNWFHVKSCTGEGLVPASYVEYAERRYMRIGFKEF